MISFARFRCLQLLISCLLSLLFSGYSVAQDKSVAEQINAVNKVFAGSFNDGNAATMAEQFSEDAILMPPGSVSLHGHKNIQTFWQGLIDTGVKVALSTNELLSDGNHAYERGSFQIIAPDQTIVDEGKFVVIWIQTENGWKLHRDIWNSNR